MNPIRIHFPPNFLLIIITGFFMFYCTSAKAQNCGVNAGLDSRICVTQQPLILSGTAGNPQSSPAAYQWTKLAGPAAIINTPAALTTTVSGLTPGNYVFQLTNKCIDGLYAKDIVSVTVLPEPPASLAGNDTILCFNTPINLSANAVSSPYQGTWTVIPSGGAFSPNANTANAVYTAPANAGIKKFIWTISNGVCTKTDTVQVIIGQPVTPVTAGPDIYLSCKGKCALLNASYQGFSPPQSGQWTVVSGPNTPVFSNSASAASKVCSLVPGTYILRWTVAGPCASGTDDVTLEVANIFAPPVSLGDQVYTNFCEQSTVTSEVIAGAPLSIGETATWVQTGGGSTATFFPDNHVSSVTVGNLTGPFPYTFMYTHVGATGCTMVTSHKVYRSQPLTGLTDPADQELPCDATSAVYTMSFNELSMLNNSLTRKGVFISGPISTGIISFIATRLTTSVRTDTWSVTGLIAPGTYIYRMEYKNACGITYQDISITVSRTPGTVNAGSDIILPCNTLSVNPIGSVNTPGIYNWLQISGPNTAILTGQNTLSLEMNGLVEGVYVVRLSNSGGRTCAAKTDDMKVFVTRSIPSVVTTGADETICAGNYRLNGNTPLQTETGLWTVSPSAGINFSPNANTPNAIATGLAVNTIYTFTWTISNPCGSISDTQQLTTGSSFAPPVPDAGADICEISGTTMVSLYGNDAAGADILWTALSAGSSVSPNNTSITDAEFTGGSGTYLFEYIFSTPGCAVLKDTIAVTINTNTTVDAGTDINICAASFPAATILNAVAGISVNGFVSQWTQVSGPSTANIVTPDNPSSTVSGLQPGIYEFEYKVSSGTECPDVSDIVSVTVSQQPSAAVAGADRAICNAFSNTVITLGATAPPIGTAYWQVINAPAGSETPVFSNQNSATSTISNLTQGTYTLRWTVSNGPGCAARTDDMIININAAAAAGSDFTGCNVSSINLTGSPNTNGTWTQVSGPAATITTNSGNTAIANGLVTSMPASGYSFRYSLPAAGSCPSTSDIINFSNYPVPSQANAGSDKFLCFNETSVVLNGNAPSSGTGLWYLESGPNIPSPGASNNVYTDTVLNGLAAGIYVYQYQVNTNPACIASVDRVQVVKEVMANAQADFRVCNVNRIDLNANVPVLSPGTWSYVSGPVAPPYLIITNENNPATSVEGLIPGTYVFRWTVPGAGTCVPTTDDIRVIIDRAVPPVNAGANRIFCQGSVSAFRIGSPAAAGVTYTWIPSILLSNPNAAQPLFQGVNNAGNYVYTLRGNIGSCESFSSVNIKVNPTPFTNIEMAEGSCSATFTATAPGTGVNNPAYSWSFGADAIPASASGMGPHTVVYTSSGTKSVILDIRSSDGCSNLSSMNYTPVCVLPVKLVSFEAAWKNNFTRLSWSIEDAINLDHFETERSYDGRAFSSIGRSAYINNTKNYFYDDHTVNKDNQEIYYRLKMTDADNSFSYSPVKMIRLSDENMVNVVPNPFNDRITVSFTKFAASERIIIHIFNAQGQLMAKKNIMLPAGAEIVEMNDLGSLSAGIYILQLISGKTVISRKIMKRSL